jgi:hypothetical protein
MGTKATDPSRRVFYRGARSLRSQKPSYWSFSPRMAREYADPRGGKVFRANLWPKKYMVGPEADIARKLNIYNAWVAARVRGRTGRKASEMLHTAARKAGADALLYSNQIVVLNPKIIHPLGVLETK